MAATTTSWYVWATLAANDGQPFPLCATSSDLSHQPSVL